MIHRNKIIFGILILAFITINNAYAEEHTVKILNGNIDPSCVKTKCYDETTITVLVGDSIVWVNDDIPAHTIVSGTPFEGQDGAFDSGLILPTGNFKHTFTRDGTYPYFCVLHPWATGTVIVLNSPNGNPEVIPEIIPETPPDIIVENGTTKTIKTLGLIGEKVGSGKSFTMSYISKGDLGKSFVNMDDKFILFTFSTPAPTGDEIIMKLNEEMISKPTFVEVNGVPITDYKYIKQGNFNTLTFTTPAETWEVKIYGSHVVPEFGTMAIILLGVTIVMIIGVTRINQHSMKKYE